jgi:hypothetical protein
MDKLFLTNQLADKLKKTWQQAARADEDACLDAKTGAPRAMNLAAATRNRLDAAQSAWMAVADFKPAPLRKGERIVQDGPFADAKEQLAGFFVIDVADLDAALVWAARSPAAAGAGVEVRPVLPPMA